MPGSLNTTEEFYKIKLKKKKKKDTSKLLTYDFG